jgi:hypothetical protein
LCWARRITLIRNGKNVTDKESKSFEYEVTAPGRYCIQADMNVPGEMTVLSERFSNNMVPWILSNPIEVVAEAAS